MAALVNRPLTKAQKDKLFADRFGYVRAYFDELEAEGREVTEQDKALYSLCRPERLMELAWRFIVYDAAEKKIARYQQYFTVNSIVARVRELGAERAAAGRRGLAYARVGQVTDDGDAGASRWRLSRKFRIRSSCW